MEEFNDIVNGFSDVFEEEESKILKNSLALSPDYVPDQLIGRKKEIRDLARIFKYIDSGGKPSNALVLGYPGSGKTVVTKYLLRMLMERLASKKVMSHSLVWVYVSCKFQHNENSIIFDILKSVDPETKIPPKGHALDYYYSALWDAMKEKNASLVVVLDEIDFLKKDNLLYNLSRAGESKYIPEGHFISTIGISNDLHYGENLDPRVKSSMNFTDFVFPLYDAEQIRAILCDRVKLAFFEGAIIQETIELCASISAKSHGDARKAIELLRVSTIYAEEHGFSQVLPEHVDEVFETIDVDRFEKMVPVMAFHKKIVLLAILKLINNNKRTTNATEIKNLTKKLSIAIGEKDRARATVSNSIAELIMIGMIKEVTTRRGRGASGREIELDVPSKERLEELIYEDYRLEELRDFKVNSFK